MGELAVQRWREAGPLVIRVETPHFPCCPLVKSFAFLIGRYLFLYCSKGRVCGGGDAEVEGGRLVCGLQGLLPTAQMRLFDDHRLDEQEMTSMVSILFSTSKHKYG